MLGDSPLDLGTLELTEVYASGTVTEGFLTASRVGDGGGKSGHDS